MRILGTLLVVALFVVLSLFVFGVFSFSCSDAVSGDEAEISENQSKDVQAQVLDEQAKLQKRRTPCDTLALQEYILSNYDAGTYLVEFDKTYTYNIPGSAVIYYKGEKGENYIFGVIAKSKEGERYIEKKNLIGYESSFINLDSTKLGTAFFYLTLFKCDKGNFERVWEAVVPAHGGFNAMKLKRWKWKNILYIELNYEDGIISGHRNFNYFLIDGVEKPPHLLETYVGLVHKRTLANVNEDLFPDYLEYRFAEDTLGIRQIDSIPFYWSVKKQLYITDRNSRWYRKY